MKSETHQIYLPQSTAVDWDAVKADPSIPITVVNDPGTATKMCNLGFAAFAIVDMSKEEIAALLRSRGASVILKAALH